MDRRNESVGQRLSDVTLFSTTLLVAACLTTPLWCQTARRPAALRPGAIGLAMAAASTGAERDRAADLVRRLYEDGSWTAGLSSFYLRSRVIQTETPEGRRTELRDREPGRPSRTPSGAEPSRGSSTEGPPATPIPEKAPPEGEASRGSTTRYLAEFAFDARRLRSEYRSEGGETFAEVHLWDGKEGTQYIRTKDHESYELCKDPGFWGWLDLWGQHEWASIGGYSFWWDPRDAQGFLSANFLLPEDFTSVGREVFAGAECHVVESRAGFVRLYIGVADRRLLGKIKYVAGDGVDYLKVMRAIAGETIETTAHWKPWLKTLDPAERRRMEKRLGEASFEASHRKYFEYTFGDHRQLGPGRWVPWKVGVDIHDVRGERASVVKKTSETTILEVKADEPLRDDLFHLELKEGVQVSDHRFDLPEALPLEYACKSGRTEAELQALHEAERKDLSKYRKRFEGLTAGVSARVGQRPCDLPVTTWLNSKPLAWKDLEGKVVVLEFWAHDCGPCLGDFQVFGKSFRTFVEAGVTIIGVHTATTSRKDVEKAIESHELSIPICIDAPGPEGEGFGAMTGWFGIDGSGGKRFPYLGGNGRIRIPYAVIVGKDGRVADHGFLWEMLTKARELAAPAAPPPRR